MEEFEIAYQERFRDVQILHQQQRRIAAMHLGGVTVECLLKAMIVKFYQLSEWKTATNNPRHTIHNLGHDLQKAVRTINPLWSRVQHNQQIIYWINQVEFPIIHFIDTRYIGNEPDETRYKSWFFAWESLMQWLIKQSTQL